MRRFILVALVASGFAAFGAVPASADHVPPHQHFVVTANGTLIPVGPDACTFGPSQAFDNFHFNVHLGTPNMSAFANAMNPVSFVAPVPCPPST
jgi:type 1 fimbria pilin